MPPSQRQKLYCYVDETGQDDSSQVFVVVAVVSAREQDQLRNLLIRIEQAAGTGHRKWHKSRRERRIRYLSLVLEPGGFGDSEVFFGVYPKPLPYFLPMLDVLENAIKMKAVPPYTARVFVDGIDHKKAAELTNALRVRGVFLDLVRSRRDESEPLIRMADMWAGCIRASLEGRDEERKLFDRALATKHLQRAKEKGPWEGASL